MLVLQKKKFYSTTRQTQLFKPLVACLQHDLHADMQVGAACGAERRNRCVKTRADMQVGAACGVGRRMRLFPPPKKKKRRTEHKTFVFSCGRHQCT